MKRVYDEKKNYFAVEGRSKTFISLKYSDEKTFLDDKKWTDSLFDADYEGRKYFTYEPGLKEV